jgi:hypothetical protein
LRLRHRQQNRGGGKKKDAVHQKHAFKTAPPSARFREVPRGSIH